MQECLAGIERAQIRVSRASDIGVKNHCPFCRARRFTPIYDEQLLVLNGYNAGQIIDLKKQNLDLINDLYAPLPLNALPSWLPPFDLRTLFIVDELASWFCDEAAMDESFVWNDEHILQVAVVCWSKRIAITGMEISRVIVAHGMPDRLREPLAAKFDFATKAMVTAGGRRPVKNRRDKNVARDQWVNAMRYWGR